jgi:hypothetical protein
MDEQVLEYYVEGVKHHRFDLSTSERALTLDHPIDPGFVNHRLVHTVPATSSSSVKDAYAGSRRRRTPHASCIGRAADRINDRFGLGFPHREAQSTGRQKLDTLKPEPEHVHGVLGVEPIHLLEFRAMDPLLPPLTCQALLLGLEVPKEWPLDAARQN